ncbi:MULTISPECIES: cytochrome c [unclassified Iodidimonas]|jgi:mono/diheme cytochrome c family protein|uniref:c-type cytochrome n=1 Tax=unclassified Iodidimonas TaxID=2626145 RepID=UPI002482B9BF|nr:MULTISPECIES: cytochrome c [unclassified Iodidimonas]
MKAARVIFGGLLLAVPGSLAAAADDSLSTHGKAVYDQHCLVCHQADGGGVPNMQPELWSSPRLNGPAPALIRFILHGSADLPPEQRSHDNIMPGFATLFDEDLAALLSYLRQTFDNEAPAITAAQIARVRAAEQMSADDS